jgi:hypothetical protein
MPRPLAFVALLIALVAPLPAAAQKEPGAPKPDTYICPNAASSKAIECFLNAVEHLYTMCRQVKSIEIIEFGYDKSDEGVNGAKSEYCVDKHKVSMTRPYQAALKEATGSRAAVDGLRGLYDQWLKALADLKWVPGESDEQYKARVAKPYTDFREQATEVRVALETPAKPGVAAKPSTPAKASSGKGKAKTAAAPKSSN